MFEDIIPIVIVTVVKLLRPIMRKDLMQKINEDYYLIINTTLILILAVLYFLIKRYILKYNISLFEAPRQFSNLSLFNKLMIFVLSIMTILTTIATFKLENSKSGPSNSILMRVVNALVLLAISFYGNRDNITYKMILGYIIIFGGLLLIDK